MSASTVGDFPSGLDILEDDPGDENDDTVNDPDDAEKVEEGDLEHVTPHDDEDDDEDDE